MAGRAARSGKRSGSQPEATTFLLDECLSCTVVRTALEDSGMLISSVEREFGGGVKDLDWMPQAGAEGHAVITRDNRIRRDNAERSAYINAKLRGFFLAARGNLRGSEMAEILAGNAKKMLRAVVTYRAPFIALVKRGAFEVTDAPDCPQRRIPQKHR
ncbi:MAG: hypothetical protein ACRBN8_24095 [Nannocystales bacterium]